MIDGVQLEVDGQLGLEDIQEGGEF